MKKLILLLLLPLALSAQTTIVNTGNSISITTPTEQLLYSKSDINLQHIIGDSYVTIYSGYNNLNGFSIKYSDVTPSVASGDALYSLLNGYTNGSAGYVSTVNSSTVTLNSSAVFTGEWEDVTGYESIIVAVKTDQNGTYSLQLSSDKLTVESTLTRYYRTNQIEPPHRFSKTRKYARVVFTNTSATNQTTFKLQTILGSTAQLNLPTDAVAAQDYDATVTRPTDFKYEVALGRRQGFTTWNKFGYNTDIDIGTEVVCAQGGTLTILTTASTLKITSSSTDDDGSPAGTGANSIVIYGIDSARNSQTEVVTMNGTGTVTTTSKWLGINRAAIYLAGSTYNNVGNITITATTGGSIQGYMPAGKSTTEQLIYFTQDNHQFLADWLVLDAEKLAGGTQPIVQFRGWVWSAVSNAKYEVLYSVVDLSVETAHILKPSQPFIIGEKSVFWIEATTDQNNTVVSGRFSGIEVKDVNAE